MRPCIAMPRSRRSTLLPASLLCVAGLGLGLALASSDALGRQLQASSEAAFLPPERFVGVSPTDFRLETMPLRGDSASVARPAVLPHVGSHGSTVIALSDGALVIDRDSGQLSRVDASGSEVASLSFHPGAGELVRDPRSGRVYLADRHDDRVVVLTSDGAPKVLDGARVREPHGLALSPDGATLYVTSVANRELVALDSETLHPRWRLELNAEPRGVAVAPDGRRALVGFLTSGALASVELDGASPSAHYISLEPGQRVVNNSMVPGMIAALPGGGASSPVDSEAVGRRFARNTFAVAFIGDGLAVAPHQLSTPQMASTGAEDLGTYGGGGFMAPITHRLAMLDNQDEFAPQLAFVAIGLHQPRALAYDGTRDTLYLAGYGNDVMLAIGEVSRNAVHLAWHTGLVTDGQACGADGIDVLGDDLWVHCELSRRLVHVDLASASATKPPSPQAMAQLAASPRSPAAQRGAELFRRGDDFRLSGSGVMACASCHPEGRSDGLSWRIEGHSLQTPMLAGRLAGAHPFKWDGKDADLRTSLTNTIGRLGGSGLTPEQVSDLQAFLESLPAPRAPDKGDASAVARGRELFTSETAACSACHDGPMLSDGSQHDLATAIGPVDTPSLIGLAHSAPYYHDGSARTLRSLLTERGSVHSMGETDHLSPAQIDDLVAYLETL